MKKIVIIGSGALAADLTVFFENTSMKEYGEIHIKGYIDYDYNIEKYWKRYNFDNPVLGDIDNYRINDDEYYVIGIADVKFRKIIIEKIREKRGNLINLIHPTALVPRNSIIGVGNVIGPYSKIGDFNVVLAYSMISHDCVIGNNNVFASALLCGHVKAGDDNYFGARSTVIPHINLGSRNTIQAGMVLHDEISDDTVVFYRFKERILAIPAGKSNE
jgi:acetyltransferase-like isoleucine patch superfamily enzyme